MKKNVWFITGCSSGFGKEIAKQLLDAGECVVATARNISSLDDLPKSENLMTLTLDVKDKAAINTCVDAAIARFGRIDKLINNAGYGQMGALEEVSDADLHEQFETNFWGVVHLTRAVLPHMRLQKSGTIQVVSSIAGLIGSAGASVYNASKFALEGMFEALSVELQEHNIQISIVEPGPFRTAFLDYSLKLPEAMEAYTSGAPARTREFLETGNGKQIGDPVVAVQHMISVCNMPQPPLRLVLGASAYDRYKNKLNKELEQLEAIKQLAISADYPV
jgi:NAD(P)-dependent dehydrogenase (short-subunit alcohol dehydrogenase family)